MNRHLIFIAISFLIVSNLFGRCISSGYSVWPRSKTLVTNSIFILTGYGNSQQIIHNLSIYNVYLESYTDSIKLDVLKIYTGEYGITQAVLKPTTKLSAGETYSLRIANLSGEAKHEFNNEDFSWKILDKSDNDNPQWQTLPSYIGKQWIRYGCGPEANAKFCICFDDNSPVIVLARLKEIKSGITNEYFVEPDSTVLSIGHGMCYGAFYFVDNWEYEVSFSLMDASGNKIDSLTTPISFIGPTEADSVILTTKCDCKIISSKKKTSSSNLLLYLLGAAAILTTTVYILRKKGSR